MALRDLYRRLPEPLRRHARPVVRNVDRIPFTASDARRRWISTTYTPFGRESQQRIMLSIARYAHINRPIDGMYMEFGSHEANTMRMAWDAFHHLFDWRYVAFDSFEGLPEIAEIDRQPIWERGKLKTAEEEFLARCRRHGMPERVLTTVKGFYADSLTPELAARLAPDRAAVVYVDCDLYESTVPVLEFVRPFLQLGTVLVFDDWNCFHGRPDRGERLAFREFCAAHPDVGWEPFVSTQEAMSFLCVDPGAVS